MPGDPVPTVKNLNEIINFNEKRQVSLYPWFLLAHSFTHPFFAKQPTGVSGTAASQACLIGRRSSKFLLFFADFKVFLDASQQWSLHSSFLFESADLAFVD
jgi:hypothetical protein